MKKTMLRFLSLLLCLSVAAPLTGCVALIASQQLALGGGSFYRAGLAQTAQAEFGANGGVSGGGWKYCSYFGREIEDWCVDFVYYCAAQSDLVGEGKPFGPHTAACSVAWRQLAQGGAMTFTLFDAEPQPGDVVFWYATDQGAAAALDRVDDLCHVGIVADYADGLLTTVEGNCGASGCSVSYVSQNQYAGSSLTGQCWNGAAIFGFARIQGLGGVSSDLTGMVKAFEGFTRYPTWDYSQWSVGYGTRCPDDMLAFYQQNGIPEEEAVLLLKEHLDTAMADVIGYIGKSGLNLTDFQRDALASLTYNIGSGWMAEGSYTALKAALQGGSEQQLMQAFADICHAGGVVLPSLVERRICEAHLFLTGQYITDYRLSGYTYIVSGGAVTVFKKGAG